MPRLHATLDLDELLAHRDFVRALARSLIRDPDRAEDIVQDTWVAALEHPPRRWAGAAQLRSWLASVARNFARQTARRESRGLERERRSAQPEGLPSAAEVVQREAKRRAVVEAVLALDEPYRSALLLRYYHELPPRDIARRLALPVETVRTRLRRGLEKLRARLDAQQEGGREAWVAGLAAFASTPPVAPPVARWAGIAAGAGVGIVALGLAVWWMQASPAVQADGSTSPRSAPSDALGSSSPDNSTAALVPILDAPTRESIPASAETPIVAPALLAALPSPSEVHYTLVPPERHVAGRVVDERDQPIAGALVYVGNQIRARGDEPFKPFQEQRISDGVRTDLAGRFEIGGQGRVLTAWHADYGAATVVWERAEHMVLHDKVVLRGFLVDGAGNPLGGKRVALDRGSAESATQSDGAFEFEGVSTGPRGLRVDGGRYFVVDLPPRGREPVRLVLDSRRIPIELRSGPEPFLEDVVGAWVGLDAALPIEAFRSGASVPPKPRHGEPVVVVQQPGGESGVGEASTLAPGRYLLLLAGARAVPVEVPAGADAMSVDIGAAKLTVRGPPGSRVYLLPEGSSEFMQLMAGRVCSTPIPDSGVLQLSALPAGRFEIGVDREGILGPVEIGPDGATVVLE
jgi:RNA polymerase sigma-70 factor (ECF subfamily)